MTVIKNYKTLSFCYRCQKPVDAEVVYKSDNKVYLKQFCNCIDNEFIVENDYVFWDNLLNALKNNTEYGKYEENDNTGIDVTSRCNLCCKHCYYQPDNSIPDKPIEEIIKLVKLVKTNDVILVGAEPTMRKDIFELVNKVAELKEVTIQTNGQKLADLEFVKGLKKTKLKQLDISINNDKYHSNIEIYNRAIKGLWNAVKNNICIGNLSFLIVTQEDAQKAVDFILKFEKKFYFLKNFFGLRNDLKSTKYLIYTPIRAGRYVKEDPLLFVSDLYKMFSIALANRNIEIDKDIFDGVNTPYEIALKLPIDGSIQLHGYTNASQGFDLKVVSEYSKIRPYFIVGEGYIDFIAHAIAIEKLSPDYLKKVVNENNNSHDYK
jgi:organic radical activating enzyme